MPLTALLTFLGVFSVVSFVGSLLAVPWLIGRMPVDYFMNFGQSRTGQPRRHPAVAALARGARNVLAVILLAAGFAMLFLPGQGLLTMFVGLCLLDFPGKDALILLLVGKAAVQKGLNWVRRKRGQPEFVFAHQV